MNYDVFLSEPAEAEAEAAFLWLARFSPNFAGEWYDDFLGAIASLSNFPGRCPLAPENDDFSGREVRQYLYRKGRTVYRILFDIMNEDTVRVMHVRHTSQQRGGATSKGNRMSQSETLTLAEKCRNAEVAIVVDNGGFALSSLIQHFVMTGITVSGGFAGA